MPFFLKNLKNKLYTEYVGDFLKLFSGSTISQIIAFGFSPILYRLYEKNDYGIFGYYVALVTVLGSFSSLQYLQAIFLEEKESDSKSIVWLNRVVNFLVSLVCLLVVWIFNEPISQMLKSPDLGPWLYLLPFSLFFMGQNEIYRVWSSRKKKFKLLAENSIITAITVPVFSISFGIWKSGPMGLFVGYLLSQLIPALVLEYRIPREERVLWSDFNLVKIKEFAWKYRKFPKINLPSDIINRLSNQIPVFMLGQFGVVSGIAIYGLCARILSLPSQVISSAIGEIFRQRASLDYLQKGSFNFIFLQTLKLTGGISFVIILGVLILGPWFFGFIYGEQWVEAGDLSRYLILFFMVKFIVSPLSFTVVIKQKLNLGLFKNIVTFLLVSFVFYFGFNILNLNYFNVLSLFALVYAFIDVFYLMILFKLSR